MGSHEYRLRGFNVSEWARDFLDALAFGIIVLTLGYRLGLPVSLDLFWLFCKMLAVVYSSVRVAEFSDKVFKEVTS